MFLYSIRVALTQQQHCQKEIPSESNPTLPNDGWPENDPTMPDVPVAMPQPMICNTAQMPTKPDTPCMERVSLTWWGILNGNCFSIYCNQKCYFGLILVLKISVRIRPLSVWVVGVKCNGSLQLGACPASATKFTVVYLLHWCHRLHYNTLKNLPGLMVRLNCLALSPCMEAEQLQQLYEQMIADLRRWTCMGEGRG